MNKLEVLQKFLSDCETDFIKFFDKGNSVAGTRVRKHMQELKKMANDIRTEVQNKKVADKKN